MILMLEILLTASAFRKGWRALAFVPIVLTFALAFLIGAATNGGAAGAGLLLDLVCLAALAVMSVRTPAQIARTASTVARDLAEA